ncbi:hypothetical protein [Chryseobacterium indoltheticum]|uniref:Uncharacterized protein n=1 Tax=Chryseobacterium indoltheticum TaxID=254 RepID=A0A381FQS7_9FLAO|nr:hypothetical protein [Chryseobacterium indoltheticum]SUX48882.1 Uncharacterised protein [Chryseobacterium indoltheticum]
MEKKTIQVDSNIPKSILIGFVFALLTVFIIQHFSTFSYIPNTSNLSNYTSDGKIILNQEYDTRTTPVGALYQTTPFGTKIDLPTNGMMCSELLFDDSDFKKYSNKVVLYVKSVFTDYKYLLLFWFGYTLIILFFKRYRLKVLILILPISMISCENKIVREKGLTTAIQADTIVQNIQPTTSLPDIETMQKRYSFVVFEGDAFLSYEGQKKVVTGIFETDALMNKDEEYKIIDEAQQKAMINLELKHVDKRYILNFDSYAEASERREILLGINQNKRNEEQQPFDNNQEYTVIQPKAYFHQKPNQNSRKDTYLLYGAKIIASDETRYFVFTTFTNTDGVTSKGWVLKTDIEAY